MVDLVRGLTRPTRRHCWKVPLSKVDEFRCGSFESRIAFLQAVINSASEILDFEECTSSMVRLTFLSISPAGRPRSTSTSNSAASLVDS